MTSEETAPGPSQDSSCGVLSRPHWRSASLLNSADNAERVGTTSDYMKLPIGGTRVAGAIAFERSSLSARYCALTRP